MPKPAAPAKDAVDQAIEGAAKRPIEMEQMTVTIATTGRPVVIAFPSDMSDQELLEFMGWMGQGLRLKLLAGRQRTAGGRIVLPTGIPIPT